MSDYELTEAHRRIANIIQIGTVLEADYPNARLRVQIGELPTAWLPWMTRAGSDREWWAPEAGEQVVVAAPSGELAQGIIIGSLFKAAHPAPADSAAVHRVIYSDGAVMEYNRTAKRARITLPEGGRVELVATGGVEITGDVHVDGDVIASGVSLVNHVHTGVMPGGAFSGEPDQ